MWRQASSQVCILAFFLAFFLSPSFLLAATSNDLVVAPWYGCVTTEPGTLAVRESSSNIQTDTAVAMTAEGEVKVCNQRIPLDKSGYPIRQAELLMCDLEGKCYKTNKTGSSADSLFFLNKNEPNLENWVKDRVGFVADTLQIGHMESSFDTNYFSDPYGIIAPPTEYEPTTSNAEERLVEISDFRGVNSALENTSQATESIGRMAQGFGISLNDIGRLPVNIAHKPFPNAPLSGSETIDIVTFSESGDTGISVLHKTQADNTFNIYEEQTRNFQSTGEPVPLLKGDSSFVFSQAVNENEYEYEEGQGYVLRQKESLYDRTIQYMQDAWSGFWNVWGLW
jgi:hypothetical protein